MDCGGSDTELCNLLLLQAKKNKNHDFFASNLFFFDFPSTFHIEGGKIRSF